MNLYPLIKLLSSGQFQTGTQLGEQLGISRTAVWKQVQQLSKLGLDVITKKNDGYCLSDSLSILNTDLIQEYLLNNKSKLEFSFIPVIDSTNLELSRRIANQSLSASSLLIAEKQTSGRGRHGKSWQSPYASSISMSISYQMAGGANVLQGLSLAVGVVLAQVLTSHGINGVKLKWPNDLYLNNAKLGGILIDLSGDLAGPCNVIVGVGINIFKPSLPIEVDQPVAYLSDQTSAIERSVLVADIAIALEKLLLNYAIEGFKPWQDHWNKAHLWTGKKASIITPLKTTEVVLGGVNNLGELEVTYKDGSKGAINSGEVSVRAKE